MDKDILQIVPMGKNVNDSSRSRPAFIEVESLITKGKILDQATN